MAGNELFNLILMAVILVGVGVFVSEPLLRARTNNMLVDEYVDTPVHHLLSRKDSIYIAMKDLEFDFTTGKLSDQDYKELREKFAAQAAQVLKEIDDLEAGEGQKPEPKAKVGKSVCPTCGFGHREGDRFCQSCGAQFG